MISPNNVYSQWRMVADLIQIEEGDSLFHPSYPKFQL